jgi:ribonuclease P/MRP protein subunit POP7
MDEIIPQFSDSANLQPSPEQKLDRNLPGGTGSKASKVPSLLLADIKFERKNKPQPRLPQNHTIRKRPITHPPIAAPYAGPDVQKVVYVSRNTPIMAAVKRVRKLLDQAEKRNLQREGVLGNGRRAGKTAALGRSKNDSKQEAVLVKGSGRAMEQAAKVGEWFKRHAEDGDGRWVVDVRPTSVKVIDDIVENVSLSVDSKVSHDQGNPPQKVSTLDHSVGDDIQSREKDGGPQAGKGNNSLKTGTHTPSAAETDAKQKSSRHKKRKRSMYDADDIPEARSRFIHAVEIAVSLQG